MLLLDVEQLHVSDSHVDLSFDLFLRNLLQIAEHLEMLLGREFVPKNVELRADAQYLPDFGDVIRNIKPVNLDLAPARRQLPCQNVYQRAFSCT